MQERLAGDGIRQIAISVASRKENLIRRYGKEGARLFRLCRGEDRRPVSPGRETKSNSAETTLDADLSNAEALRPLLWSLCEKLARRLTKERLATHSLTLKLKTKDFQIRNPFALGLCPDAACHQALTGSPSPCWTGN